MTATATAATGIAAAVAGGCCGGGDVTVTAGGCGGDDTVTGCCDDTVVVVWRLSDIVVDLAGRCDAEDFRNFSLWKSKKVN